MPTRPDRLFLDWNAGAPLAPAARLAMLDVLALTGNPSSIHAEGRAARARVESARRRFASGIGADPKSVAFSSGGTEANVTALAPGVTDASGVPCTRLVLSAVEHPSVLAGGRFAATDVRRVGVDGDGRLDLADLDRTLTEIAASGERALVSLMLANNETGVIQPVAEAAAIAHARGALLHTDAVQAFGKIGVDLADLGADVMTLSGHKIGAPRGVGAVVRAGEAIRIPPLLTGGGQEFGSRAGTENAAAMAGFGALAGDLDAVLAGFAATAPVRDAFETMLTARHPDAVIFGRSAPRLPNTTAFALPGVPAEMLLIALDLEGIAVSSGAACSSGKVTRSHVLEAMGVADALAAGAIRVSFGPDAAPEQAERLAMTLSAVLARARKAVPNAGRAPRRGDFSPKKALV